MTQWPNSYGNERKKLIWAAFKEVEDWQFTDAVTECLGSCRAAPLIEDLSKGVESAKRRGYQQELRKAVNPLEILSDAEMLNTTADPDFVKTCIKLLQDYQSGLINKKQFDQGCNLLDETAKQFKYMRGSAKATQSKPGLYWD